MKTLEYLHYPVIQFLIKSVIYNVAEVLSFIYMRVATVICMVMPIYVLVMQAVYLQCMLGPRAFTGRHVE